FGPPSPLGHLWSLAIEEQFYLVWPLLLLAGLRWVRSRRALLLVAVGAATASAVEMGLLFTPDGNPTRIYDGTDTRAFALLIGAALALVRPRHQASATGTTVAPGATGSRRFLEAVGAVSLVGIFVMFWQTNQYEPFLYEGGMVLLAVLTALVVAATIHPSSRVGSLLGWEPLRWVGERSYALYLWHYPVIVLTTPLDARPDLLRAGLQVGASMALATVSWRYIEQPVRHGALGRLWGRLRRHDWSWARLRPGGRLAAGGMVALTAVGAAGLSGLVSAPADGPASRVTSIVPASHHHPPPATMTTIPDVTSVPTTSIPPSGGQGVTAIGDSIMIDASPYLRQALPGIVIDARVGQQLYQVQSAVPTLKANGNVGNRLIIELGTNGPFSVSQLEALLSSLGPMQRIVLVNTRVPRPWQNQVNGTIAAVARTYPNTTMVNWYADSAAYPQYFYPDGVHLDPQGAKYFASLLVQALDAPLPRAGR
ncbi:MAG: acyltransferase family protein, partial [Acidimicrobiales bacterium]